MTLRRQAHAVVAFNTVDKGIVYIEPQFDRPVVLTVGRSYSQVNSFKLASAQDDTIERLTVVW